jgi:predicted TIM-barrel fold metal-dependent hydrolase
MARTRPLERDFPHAPDVLERETADGGFSAGWGLHHLPAETYILDCHTHMRVPTTGTAMRKAVRAFYERAGAMRLRRHVALDGAPERIKGYAETAAKDDRFTYMVWLEYDKPDLKFLKKCAKLPGFVGLKLHNFRVIQENAKPSLWRAKIWDEIFEFCGEIGKPVLWHVTQRHTTCPYMGGGQYSYWKVGWQNGVKYGNRELLDVFEECMAANRRTDFIGAHHLHIGPAKIGKLLRKHANLYTDLSCGNIVRFCDDMYEPDRQAWRAHVLKFPERILFGTDCHIGSAGGLWYLWETLAAHIRFLHQLRLPKAVLEQVAHENFERLAGLPVLPLNGADWQFVRP